MIQNDKTYRASAGRIISSVFSNYAGFGIRVAITLITTPLFIKALGLSLYGSWVLLWSFAAYLTFLDLGLGIAIRKFVAKAIATGDLVERDLKFNACLSIYLIISVLVIVGGLPIVGLFGNTIGLDESVKPIIWRIGIFLVLDVAVSFPLNAFQGLLTAYQRYELTNGIRVGMEVVRNVSLVVAASKGMDLAALAGIQFATSLLTFVFLWISGVYIARPLKIKLFRLDPKLFREIFIYSGWVAMLLGSQQALSLSSSILVGYFDNAAVVAEFYVAYRLVSFLSGIPALMTNVLMPLSSEREALGDWLSLQRVFMIGNNAQALLFIPIATGAILLGGEFFLVWLGPGFDQSARYLILLVVPVVLTQGTACSIAMGAGHQQFIAIITGLSALLTLGLAILSGKEWGVIGICYAYGATSVISNFFTFLYTCRLLKLDPLTSLLRIWSGPLICAVPQALVTVALLSHIHSAQNFGHFLAIATCSFLVYGMTICLSFSRFPTHFVACQKLVTVFMDLPMVRSFLWKKS